MDLRFHHDHAAAQVPGNLPCLSGAESNLSSRRGHAMSLENDLRLVLVDFHMAMKLLMLTCAFSQRNSKLTTVASRARVLSSSVGTKLLIGVTGLALFLYLIV